MAIRTDLFDTNPKCLTSAWYADESFSVLLSVADRTLVLRDSETFLAMVDPHKALGPSAFGQLQFRPVQADGRKGDWQPLATLVRVPVLKELRCPESADQACPSASRAPPKLGCT
jgi:hypothetical protein